MSLAEFLTFENSWFIVVIAIIIGYTILDGFDLGVGALHLFAKGDNERRVMLNTIGPVWDGNEVWLVCLGGALFAGFPHVYATLFSAFYTPLMVLLSALIFRAVAIEFRSKQPAMWWRKTWDVFFSVASIVVALCLGLVIGNLIQGIPLNEHKEFVGDMSDFFQLYPILVGLTTVALFMMHGAIYVVMKTEGEFCEKIRTWINPTIIFFIICYGCTTMATLIYMPHMTDHLRERPFLFTIVFLNMLAIANIPREIHHSNYGLAFVSSCANIAFLVILFAMGTFPVLVRSVIEPSTLSLTVQNSQSSPLTLSILLIIVAIGIPLVLLYTVSIYWIFRGKVKLDHMSY